MARCGVTVTDPAVYSYPAVIERSTDGFGVFFPDLPGCTNHGDTIPHATYNAVIGLQAHIELSVSYGDTLPKPSALNTMHVDPDIQEVARILVRVAPRTSTAP